MEPVSGSRIDVWIGGQGYRKKYNAWYDPTRKGYVIEEDLLVMSLRLEPTFTTGPAAPGSCTVARFDHCNPPYGPQCTLLKGHVGEHRYPDESPSSDDSELLG